MNTHFDKNKHEYFVDGVLVPSITQIISRYFNFSFVPKSSLDLGKFEHEIFEQVIRNEHDKNDSFSSNMRNYIAGLLGDYEVLQTETPLFSKQYMFAGTPDAVIKHNNKTMIVEYKSNRTYKKYVMLQLAAQRLLVHENGVDTKENIECLCVYGGEKYSRIYFEKSEIENAERVFLKMLEIHNNQTIINLFLGVKS